MPDRRKSGLSQLRWDEVDDAVKGDTWHNMYEKARSRQRKISIS